MGARPRWALVAAALPARRRGLARRLRRAASSPLAEAFGVRPDRRRHHARAAQHLRHRHRRSAAGAGAARAGARAGDELWVSGDARRSRHWRLHQRLGNVSLPDAASRAVPGGARPPAAARSNSASRCAAWPRARHRRLRRPARRLSATSCERSGVAARNSNSRACRARRWRPAPSRRAWRGTARCSPAATTTNCASPRRPRRRRCHRGAGAQARPAACAHRPHADGPAGEVALRDARRQSDARRPARLRSLRVKPRPPLALPSRPSGAFHRLRLRQRPVAGGAGHGRHAGRAWLTCVLLITPYFADAGFLAFLAAAFVVGVWACEPHRPRPGRGRPRCASSGTRSSPFWLVLLLTPDGWLWQLAAFMLFRCFDIIKPQPARWIDGH